MIPDNANNQASALAFFRQESTTSENLYFDPRVKVNRVIDGVAGSSSASLELQWLEHRMATSDGPELIELSEAKIADRYGPTVRCAVGVVPPAGGSLVDIDFLAHGFLDAPGIQFGTSGKQSFFRRTMLLRSLAQRSLRKEAAIIQGRYMYSRAIDYYLDLNPPPDLTVPLAIPWTAATTHVTALPAIFNNGGKPNRRKQPIRYDAPNCWALKPIHVFTYDDDPDAEYWTYLQALRYLVMVHLPFSLDTDDTLGPGNLFDTACEGAAAPYYWEQSESSIGSPTTVLSGWQQHMVRNCHSLAVDGMNLLQALNLISAESGMQFHETHSNQTQGEDLRVLSDLRFWCPGDLPTSALSLERNGSAHITSDGRLRSVSDALTANNVNSATLQRDFGNTFGKVKVAGDRRWVAVRSLLLPLWQPSPLWDDVSSANAETYVEDAASEDMPFVENTEGEFFKRYNPKGEYFHVGENKIIGRLWGIDPAGELDPTVYERSQAPFTNYSPWEFPGIADAVRRRRVMRPLSGTNERNHPLGVVLEISFDSGSTWHRYETRYQLLQTRSAILLNSPNLLSIGKEILENLAENPNEILNYYDAFLRGFFRLRATFEIDADDCLLESASTSISPLASQAPTKMICKPKDFQFGELDSTVEAGIASEIQARDDRDAATRLAEAHLANCAGAQWKGNPVIPWIEIDDFSLGTPIEGIRREVGGPVEIKFGGSANQSSMYPCVVQKVYRAKDQSTELTLHDHSMRKGLAP